MRGQRTEDRGQNGGQENNRPKDRAKDRAEDRTRDRTENSTGQEQNLLGLPLQGGHEEAVRSPAVVQGRVHLGNRVERTEIGQSTGWRTGELQDKGQGGGQD